MTISCSAPAHYGDRARTLRPDGFREYLRIRKRLAAVIAVDIRDDATIEPHQHHDVGIHAHPVAPHHRRDLVAAAVGRRPRGMRSPAESSRALCTRRSLSCSRSREHALAASELRADRLARGGDADRVDQEKAAELHDGHQHHEQRKDARLQPMERHATLRMHDARRSAMRRAALRCASICGEHGALRRTRRRIQSTGWPDRIPRDARLRLPFALF
jgi:hypothetical protein